MNVKTSLKKFFFENLPLSLRARLLLLILGSLLPLLVLIAYLASQNRASPMVMVSMAGGAAILSVGIALFLSNRIISPIRHLTQGAKRVSSGDFTVRVEEEGTDEISELSRAFNKLGTNLQSLQSINSVTLGTRDLDQLLSQLLESVVASTGTQGGAIALLDRSTDEIATVSSFRLPPDLIRLRHKVGEGLLGQAVVTGRSVVVMDAQRDARVTNPAILSLGARSLVVLPLKSREGIIGVVYVVSMERREFSEADLRILEIMTDRAALAIENAQLFGELEERKETLELLNKQLTQANQYKDEFLGIISHELRTPLNVITGSTDLLLDNFLGELTAEQRKALQITSKNAADLLGLINGILDLYRLQIGERPVRVEDFRMEDLCTEVEESFCQTAQQKGLNFTWRCERIVSPLHTDRLKLKELLHNLVANAVKFTEQGKVEVRVAHEQGEDRLRIEVEDTGIGIDKEVLPFVFEPFRQGDSSTTRKYGGAGLGLTIAKRLLDLLGGEIEVQSERGKGSLFRCRLPTRLEASSSPPNTSSS